MYLIPTDTVYGVACVNPDKIYELKNRPRTMPLQIMYPSVAMALNDLDCDRYQELCVKSLLPGPFTLILKHKRGEKIGVRIPKHSVCNSIAQYVSRPLYLTSANPHGKPPALDFEDAKEYFPDLDGIDGECVYGMPSMVIDLTNAIR